MYFCNEGGGGGDYRFSTLLLRYSKFVQTKFVIGF